ncbi:Peroxynitrite isomerase THAP4 [Frankliniella fusca]|uniref:Peroxynitrite isomerase THAP4 n=1 Tax=Frankliniella fusca TaxID=407009 RepID=A0AAE1GZM6_9NEOP|nr:Peroxynitrite isomerase THAP4 [Frankliniella fusca]
MRKSNFRCWVPHCPNSRKRTRSSTAHFHAFPVKHPERCRQWLQVVGYEDLIYLPMHSLKMRYVCSEHFLESDYSKTSYNASLLSCVIPSKFPPGTVPLSDEVMKEWPPKLASDNLFSLSEPYAVSQPNNKLLSSAVSAGILTPSDSIEIRIPTLHKNDPNIEIHELPSESLEIRDSSIHQSNLNMKEVSVNHIEETDSEALPQDQLLNRLKQNAGQGLMDGDMLLGFIVKRGSSLEVVPVGPGHSMMVASCLEELLSPGSGGNETENVS